MRKILIVFTLAFLFGSALVGCSKPAPSTAAKKPVAGCCKGCDCCPCDPCKCGKKK